METSVMMHFVPEFVLPLSEPAMAGTQAEDRGDARGLGLGIRPMDASLHRHRCRRPPSRFGRKGRTLLSSRDRQIGQFLVDLAAADPWDLYEDPEA